MKKMIDWNDEEQVLKSVSKRGCTIEFTSSELRKNKKIVLEAVSRHGCALKKCITRITKQ